MPEVSCLSRSGFRTSGVPTLGVWTGERVLHNNTKFWEFVPKEKDRDELVDSSCQPLDRWLRALLNVVCWFGEQM